MATITLEYNSRNRTAGKILSLIFAMDDIFKVKNTQYNHVNATARAMQDAIDGNVILCENFEDYLKQTADYA